MKEKIGDVNSAKDIKNVISKEVLGGDEGLGGLLGGFGKKPKAETPAAPAPAPEASPAPAPVEAAPAN